MKFDSEHLAAITWSRIAEGEDEDAVMLTRKFGYEKALRLIQAAKFPESDISTKAIKRWRIRLDNLPDFDVAALAKQNISVITPADHYWPRNLNDLGLKAPICLWVKGDPGILSELSVSIVGMRAASSEGLKTAFNFSFELAPDFPIISGGAIGIDAAAHKGAIAAGDKTVIVSAGGVNRIYPVANTEIYEKCFATGGAIISESPLGAAPQRYRFLSRNRIIAALSRGTIVVEAGWRSGALNTARRALEIGREVGAVPGSVYRPETSGSNELLRNGASAVITSAHVRELISPIGSQLMLPVSTGLAGIAGAAGVSEVAGIVDVVGRSGEAGATGTSSRVQSAELSSLEENDFYSELTSIGKRVYDAVPLHRFVTTNSIAQLAGLEIPVVSSQLSKLLFAGVIVEQNRKWRRK